MPIKTEVAETHKTDCNCYPCYNTKIFHEYVKTGILRSGFTTVVVLMNQDFKKPAPHWDPVITDSELFWIKKAGEDLDQIHTAIKRFEREVWYKGLQAFIMSEDVHGHSATWQDIHIMDFGSAGRWMMTITHKPTQQSITIITAEDEAPGNEHRGLPADEGPMGQQGIEASANMALYLLETVTNNWSQFKLVRDKKIGIC